MLLENYYIYIIIIGMALVTYAARELPFILLGNKKLNEKIILWLSFIPVSVFSALIIPDLFINKVALKIDLTFNNLYLWVGICTFIVSFITKNFFVTIIFGVVLMGLIRYIL